MKKKIGKIYSPPSPSPSHCVCSLGGERDYRIPLLSGYVEGEGFLYQVEAKWKLTGALSFLICTAFSEWQGLLLLAVICFFFIAGIQYFSERVSDRFKTLHRIFAGGHAISDIVYFRIIVFIDPAVRQPI